MTPIHNPPTPDQVLLDSCARGISRRPRPLPDQVDRRGCSPILAGTSSTPGRRVRRNPCSDPMEILGRDEHVRDGICSQTEGRALRARTTITRVTSNRKRPRSGRSLGTRDSSLNRASQVRVCRGHPRDQANCGLTWEDARDVYRPCVALADICSPIVFGCSRPIRELQTPRSPRRAPAKTTACPARAWSNNTSGGG
jgi:hypothetical protein